MTGCWGRACHRHLGPGAVSHCSSVEPRHRLAEAGGRDLRADAIRLHRWALARGLDRDGLAIDACDRAGRPHRTSRRLWPQTELIKSHVANGEPDAAARVAGRVLDTTLATDPVGPWIDPFDGSGRACGPGVPASTLYHLVVAFEELLRVAGRGRPDVL